MADIKIIETEDGSHTLFNAELNETYHSTRGAVTESIHVFIKNGLDFYVHNLLHEKIPVRIFEMGFGTGLNAMLTLNYARENNTAVEYQSIEAYPIPGEVVERLNYFVKDKAQVDAYRHLHDVGWNAVHSIDDYFTFKKIHSRLEDFELPPNYFDVVYYDAFAPNKQEEVWSLAVLQSIIKSLKSGGVFVTYCAKGQLKRDLKSLECLVETLEGPPGKKEMVRATKMHSSFPA